MISTTAWLLAGLGLFFGGLQLLTENLKRLSGRRLRTLVARYTRSTLMGVLWGGAFIAVTQSGAATMFIIVSMMRSGMMAVRQAMPMIVGVNIVGALIVLILVVDIKLAVLCLIGVAGVLYKADSRSTAASLVGALFGVAMLFFGLDVMNGSVAPLADEAWFADLLSWTRGSYLLGFVIGCALSFVVQSSIAVMAVVLAFEHSGIFGLGESVMIVYGANAGSSLLTLLLSVGLKGQARQIAMFQTFYNIAGAALLVPLFYVELWFDAPLMLAAIRMITDDVGGQIAAAFILFNLIPGAILLPLLTPATALLQRLWPDTEVEVASRPKYLHEHAADDPDTGMDLVALEQARLVQYLSRMFDALRPGRPAAAFGQIQEAFGILGGTVRETLDDLGAGRRLSEDSYERLNALLSFQHSLEAAAATLSGIAREQRTLVSTEVGRRFSAAIVEGLDTIVLTLGDVLQSHDPADRAMLAAMTSDEGNGIRGVRSAYLAEDRNLEPDERLRLLAAANHAERLIWLLGDLGRYEAVVATD
ncbi:hypothetical protein GCM10017083_27290 [Thalassobaculum fulvum]|uniref:Phosphate:Na+ symporter n=1 Tax=Thalassobaculum fulvum TaxID=1633335 RepID=A0A918XSQ3_9PROT|nr:Na/Pi symporter [Thalassobaculum fulvum]GHD52089.1 hypothetical protein GCM10017083_27290 [Thalassobaculum fulvum]